MNESEERLGKFANHTFLKLWCMQNPYCKVGPAAKGSGDGDEHCDLMVIFGNDVVLFSDKRCEFSDSPNHDVGWKRWCRKAIGKSVRQLLGARRELLNRPQLIHEDSKCTKPLRHSLPPDDQVRVHLVAVANGIRSSCKEFYDGGSGSLPFYTNCSYNNKWESNAKFTIGPCVVNGHWVHLLDDVAIECILGEMDTVSDFIDYLVAREKLLSNKNLHVGCTGEENLMAAYLLKGRPKDDRWGYPADLTGVSIDETHWPYLLQDPGYQAGRRADTVSYFWDDLIDFFTHEMGVLDSEDDEYRVGGEAALRKMASRCRQERRFFAAQFLDAIHTCKPNQILRRFSLSPLDSSLAFYFVVMPRPDGIDETRYREFRRSELDRATGITSCVFREKVRTVVGIATDRDNPSGLTFDMSYYHEYPWGESQIKVVNQIRKEERVWLPDNFRGGRTRTWEYPDSSKGQAGIEVNASVETGMCPCESGELFISCCGTFD